MKRIRRVVFCFVMASGLASVVAFIVCQPSPRFSTPQLPMAPDRELPRAELHLRDGRLYCGVETNSFTGWMVEHYANGALKSRSAVSAGLLHGLSQGWHTNGQLQVTEHFKEGISHGPRTKWHPNGMKLSEGEIIAGKFHGTFRRWSESGFLIDQVEFTAGQPHGIALAFFESGFVKRWARIKDGIITDQKSWNDGEQKEAISN